MKKVHNPLDELIYRRGLEHRNTIVLIIDRSSRTGTGKSTLGIRIAQKHDTQFTLDHVFFDTKKFIKTLIKGFPPGTWIVLDEIGVSLDSRRSTAHTNVDFSQLLQIFREKEISLACTLPTTTVLDLRMEELADCLIMVNGRGVGTVYQLQVNPFESSRRTYKHEWFKITWQPVNGGFWNDYTTKKQNFINDKLIDFLHYRNKEKIIKETMKAKIEADFDKGMKTKDIAIKHNDVSIRWVREIAAERARRKKKPS